MNKLTQTILKTNIQGQLDGADIGGGICIAGAPGIGKTRSMHAIAEDLNLHMLQVSLPEVLPEELSGIPDFMPAPEMDEFSMTGATESLATKWSVPQIIASANKLAQDPSKEGCILFLDDLHRISMAVAPYLYGLLGERKLGAYALHPKVVIMAAMNDSDEAGFSGVDSPIKDRIGMLSVPFDFDYWFSNFGRGLHHYVSSFLKTHSTYIQEDESTMIEQFATPRSWTHLANEFELYDMDFIQQNCEFLAKSKISNAAAQELSRHIAYVEAIDFSQLIATKKAVNIKSLKPIDQILYAYMVNYVHSVEDAEYLMSVIDENIDCANYIGFIVGELYTKFQSRENQKSIPKGLSIVIDKLVNSYDESKYTLNKAEKELAASLEFKNHSKLFELCSEFIH